MPRRALDPGAKPFEVKVGVGFQSFGGMYQLGDPSMCPPNRFRKLVNVRLGGKDIASRSGLEETWNSATGEPVIAMIEQLKRGDGKIWFGTYSGPAFSGVLYYYGALLLDRDWPIQAAVEPATEAMQAFVEFPHLVQAVVAGPGVVTPADNLWWNYNARVLGALQPCGHLPQDVPQATGQQPHGPVLPVITLDANICSPRYAFGQGSFANTYGYGWQTPSSTYMGHSHSRRNTPLYSIDLGAGPVAFVGEAPDEINLCTCLDPIVFCLGKWIAPGNNIPIENPGVLAGKASGADGTGQQFFEVVFNTDLPKRPNGVPTKNEQKALGDPGWNNVNYLDDDELDNFFGGSLTELFRLPGKTYATRRRGDAQPDGIQARSMCVRSVRADNPITAAQQTNEILYIGTCGGGALVPGYVVQEWPDHPVYAPPVMDSGDGQVYSWDGATVKLETSGLGPWVVVTTLPDGAILAVGRTAAKMLDPLSKAWEPVTFPTVAESPRYGPGFPVAGWLEEAVPNADWASVGVMWTDRTVFKGEVYLCGFDVARLAPTMGPHQLRPLPYNPGEEYAPTVDAYGLYKFDRSAMEITRIRGGEDIFAQAVNFYPPGEFLDNDPFGAGWTVLPPKINQGTAVLCSDDEFLYYSWGINSLGQAVAVETHRADHQAIGVFDGAVFDDFYLPGAIVGGEALSGIQDMLKTSAGIYIHCSYGVYPVSSSDLALLNGGVAEDVAYLGWDQGWPKFGTYGRLFMGPK